MALGTALKRGSSVVASRSQQPACRLVKRALIAGISSTGVHVEDLRIMPAAVNRHLLKSIGVEVGVHVRPSESDAEAVQIQIFEAPGIQATPELEKELAKHYSRQEFRRASYADLGDLSFPSRAVETYIADLLATVDVDAIRAAGSASSSTTASPPRHSSCLSSSARSRSRPSPPGPTSPRGRSNRRRACRSRSST